jgi:hypothetical protein
VTATRVPPGVVASTSRPSASYVADALLPSASVTPVTCPAGSCRNSARPPPGLSVTVVMPVVSSYANSTAAPPATSWRVTRPRSSYALARTRTPRGSRISRSRSSGPYSIVVTAPSAPVTVPSRPSE